MSAPQSLEKLIGKEQQMIRAEEIMWMEAAQIEY